MKTDKDTLLPWQYTILALLWLGMLVDGAALWFSLSKSSGSVADRKAVFPYAQAYLIATLISTPMLIVSGGKKRAEVAKQKGFGRMEGSYLFVGCFCLLGSVVMAAGLGAGVLMVNQDMPWLTWAMVIGGFVSGIVSVGNYVRVRTDPMRSYWRKSN